MKTNKPIYLSAIAAATMFMASCNLLEADTPPRVKPAPLTPTHVSANINDMKWLVGSWQSVSLDERYFENWKEIGETTMQGESGSIKGTDTIVSETIVIEQRGDDLFYIPTVKGQNNGGPVSFKLSSVSDSNFIFENAAHDFPQKITYTQKAPNILQAKISGKMDGKYHAVLFPMNKVQ